MLPTTWLHLDLIKNALIDMSVKSPLNQTCVNSLFASPNSAWDIINLTKRFDTDGSAKIYFYENISDVKKINSFCKLFRGRDGAECVFPDDSFLHGKRPWLTAASFRYMVDHHEVLADVLPAFLIHCRREDLYKKYDMHTQLPDIIYSLLMLRSYGASLDKTVVTQAFANPKLGKAVTFCQSSGLFATYPVGATPCRFKSDPRQQMITSFQIPISSPGGPVDSAVPS